MSELETPGPEPEYSPVESERERRRRHARRWILYAAAIVFVLVAIYLILLIVQNTDEVPVSYVFGDADAPLLWVVVVSAIAGWLLGIATSVLIRRLTRGPR